MKLTNEFEPIRVWAEAKGIPQKGDVKTQLIKLFEEAGELSKATLTRDAEEVKDGIGDCVVVLVNLATLHGLKLEDCINAAYQVIKDRQGKMENGTFKKNG